MLVELAKDYVQKMVLRAGVGAKVMLVDSETKQYLSTVYSQSDVLKQEVFLVERIDNDEVEKLMHMKAVCFLRPSYSSLRALCRHLRDPRFGEYHLFYTNSVRESYLQDLAQADENELVKQIHEYYVDYMVLDPHLFTIPNLNARGVSESEHASSSSSSSSSFLCTPYVDRQDMLGEIDRTVEAIAALLLSLKVRKPSIRYQRSSDVAFQIAESLYRLTYCQGEGLFATERGSIEPLVLILDRTSDPITPLLTQWTYQAMVHDLLGVKNNRVDLGGKEVLTKVPKDQKQVVLSSQQDEFFKKEMYSNYGDLGIEIKNLVDSFQEASKMNHNIQSIEDMQRFVENYPEFRSKQGNVSKHVTLVTELSRIVEEGMLMRSSELEQEIACNSAVKSSTFWNEVLEIINDHKVKEDHKVKLAMLYAIRFEKDGEAVARLISALIDAGIPIGKTSIIREVLDYGGQGKRDAELFGANKSLFSRASSAAKGLKGVDNVYTQHQPLVNSLLEQMLKGKLKEQDYPFHNQVPHVDGQQVREVIIFIAGGVTYEESRCIAQLNSSMQNSKIYLGGNGILNSAQFLQAMQSRHRMSHR
jgi:vacuolar protein sorting-associated protein 45